MTPLDFTKLVQERLNVAPDGKPGPTTLAALDKAIPAKIVPAPTNGELADPRSEGVIATLHPRLHGVARLFVRRCAANGFQIRLISGNRTDAEQNALYAKGRTAPGPVVTNAKAGYSNHGFGLAFDIGIFRGNTYLPESPFYEQAGPIGEALGLSWGGRWASLKDFPHYQLTPSWAHGLKESEMLAELRRRKSSGKDYFAS
jgi:peptidoglycan L-alanyl-D-glutamate endopeptidase CwlK